MGKSKKIRFDPAVLELLLSAQPPSEHTGAWRWLQEGAPPPANWAPPVAAAAVQAAVQLRRVAPLQALAQHTSSPKALRKAAAAGLHRLRAAGVKVDRGPGRTAGLGEREEQLSPRGWVGLPDKDGRALAVATYSTREEHFVFAAWMYGVTIFEQAFGGGFGRSELRELWRDMDGDDMLVQVPFSTVLHVLEQAAALGVENENFRIFMAQVPPQTVRASRQVSPYAAFGAPSTEDLTGGRELAQEFRFGFNLDQDQMTRSVLAFAELQGRGPSDEERIAGVSAIAAELATVSLVNPEIRERFAERLRVAALALRPTEPDRARAAWTTAHTIDAGVDGAQVPFILEIARIELALMVGLPEGVSL